MVNRNAVKILIISPHVPAPVTTQAGERLVFFLIQTLAEYHTVDLVVRVPDGEEGSLKPVQYICGTVHAVSYKRPKRRTVFNGLQVIFSYYRLCRRANSIAASGEYDRIHVEWTETGLFLKKRKKMFIEAHDVLSKPMERRYRNAQGITRQVWHLVFSLTRVFERAIYGKYESVFVLSEHDRRYLLSFAPFLQVEVLSYPAGLLPFSDRHFQRDDHSILFLAAMDRGPNVEAALYFWNSILPLVRRRIPSVKFFIVGSRPVPEVLVLAEKDKNTVVTGFVEDLESYYKTTTVFVAPLLTGGGIIVKILDALASGTAVVTTSIGNEGIGALPGKQLLIADSPEAFADNVVLLLQDGTLRMNIGQAGRAYVLLNFGNETFKKTLKKIYPS